MRSRPALSSPRRRRPHQPRQRRPHRRRRADRGRRRRPHGPPRAGRAGRRAVAGALTLATPAIRPGVTSVAGALSRAQPAAGLRQLRIDASPARRGSARTGVVDAIGFAVLASQVALDSGQHRRVVLDHDVPLFRDRPSTAREPLSHGRFLLTVDRETYLESRVARLGRETDLAAAAFRDDPT